MADPISIGAGVLLGAMNERLKKIAERVSSSAVSIGLAVMLGAALQLNWGNAHEIDELVLDPIAVAYQIARVLDLTDVSEIDAAAHWLARPEVIPTAWLAAITAGVCPLRWRIHGVEIAWLLVLPASVALGPTAYWCALISLISALALFAARAALDLLPSFDRDDRPRWYRPEHAPEFFIMTVANFLFTPVLPVIRMFNGIAAGFTFEPRPREPATGASGRATSFGGGPLA